MQQDLADLDDLFVAELVIFVAAWHVEVAIYQVGQLVHLMVLHQTTGSPLSASEISSGRWMRSLIAQGVLGYQLALWIVSAGFWSKLPRGVSRSIDC